MPSSNCTLREILETRLYHLNYMRKWKLGSERVTDLLKFGKQQSMAMKPKLAWLPSHIHIHMTLLFKMLGLIWIRIKLATREQNTYTCTACAFNFLWRIHTFAKLHTLALVKMEYSICGIFLKNLTLRIGPGAWLLSLSSPSSGFLESHPLSLPVSQWYLSPHSFIHWIAL